MGTVSEEEADKMTKEHKKEFCTWCWFKDYGDCDKCALFKQKSNFKESK